jgi:hypothetical protein
MSKQALKSKNKAIVPEVVEPVLSRRHEGLIVALLANPMIKDAALSAGVSESTIWRAMQTPDFQRRYKEAREKSFEHALGSLQAATSKAVDRLLKNVDSINETVSNQAAKFLLDYSLKVHERFDLMERVRELEGKLKDRKDGA